MQLMFVRHGIAVERAAGLPDFDRPLTPKGQERTKQIAEWLQARGVCWDVVLSSPLVRAKQTAEILWQTGLAPVVDTFEALAPGGDFNELAIWWRSQKQGINAIAVVGHQPDLGAWVELAVWGQASGCIQMKKAGVAIVEFPAGRLRLGAGLLQELLTPKSMVGSRK